MVAIQQRLANVHPAPAQRYGRLTVFALLGPSGNEPAYDILRAQTTAGVQVSEVNDHGVVALLKVINSLESPLFLLDGQELVGAKQNRILNADVLVPPKTTISIPVSCVEAGRWQYRANRHFSSGRIASHCIRSGKQERVRRSLTACGQFDAVQSEVWREVGVSMSRSRSSSHTSALSDAYDRRQKELSEFKNAIDVHADAIGLAIFDGQRLLGLDLFDRHDVLAAFWPTLLESYLIDFLSPEDNCDDGIQSKPEDVSAVLRRTAAAAWERFKSPGEGDDHRLIDDELAGSALVWQDQTVLHLQVFPKNDIDDQDLRRGEA